MNRSEIKQRGKEAFKNNYFAAVAVSIITILASGNYITVILKNIEKIDIDAIDINIISIFILLIIIVFISFK